MPTTALVVIVGMRRVLGLFRLDRAFFDMELGNVRLRFVARLVGLRRRG
ncbi:hypothetical protein [Variovorax sp. SRS16]|nr:hypothetical protein [Variovorax sp. SRS16]